MSSKARSRRSAKLILLTRGWHSARMPTGRHLGHRAPNDADKERTARAVARAADLAPTVPTPAGGGHWQAAQVERLSE
jgi:hypothetical protein